MPPTLNQIRNYRQRQGMTLQQLAEASGTTKSQIDKLEKGERRLTVDWLMRLAKPLGCDPRDLLSLTPQNNTAPVLQAVNGSLVALPTLPVRGAARGGSAQEMFWTDGPIDQIPRPAFLAHVRDAYAVYVVGDSMAPMYRPRQLLFVNPHKPPATGSGVVVTQKDGAVLIKEYVRHKAHGVMLREYQPDKRDFTLSLSQIASLHTVVGATEPQ